MCVGYGDGGEAEAPPLTPHPFRCPDYRQLVFLNVMQGMKSIVDTMDDWEISVEPQNRVRLAPGALSAGRAGRAR